MIITLLILAATLAMIAFLCPERALTVDSGEIKADAIVVLGGGDGRAERAAELYKQGAAPKIIVSGFGDCERNAQTIERRGVPREAITREPDSKSTLENAKMSIPILRQLGAQRVIIVTSWYHSRRGLACFEHLAPDLTFYSRPSYFDSRAQLKRIGRSELVNFEYVKILGYWVRNGVSPF